jgi:hypothetical protein
MKHVELFENFINENLGVGDKDVDYKNSIFAKIPELIAKRNVGPHKRGELSSEGELAQFIFDHPGSSWISIKRRITKSINPSKYHLENSRLDSALERALRSGFVKKTEYVYPHQKPLVQYYAFPSKELTLEEMQEFFNIYKHPTPEDIENFLNKKRGSIKGRKFNF